MGKGRFQSVTSASGLDAQDLAVGMIGEQVHEPVGPLADVTDAMMPFVQVALLLAHAIAVDHEPHEQAGRERADEQGTLPGGEGV